MHELKLFFTPGPWQREPAHNGLGHVWRITAPEARHVAYVSQSENGIWKDVRHVAFVRSHHANDNPALCDGNAALIAHAPDLLIGAFAAMHALRSYQYGNAAPDLAEDIANRLEMLFTTLQKEAEDATGTLSDR